MKKHKIIIALILSCLLMFLYGCNTQPSNFNDNIESNTNNDSLSGINIDNDGFKHYEINLTAENYQPFLSFLSGSNDSYILSGVLSYAYYENVVVTFDITCEYRGGDSGDYTYQGEYSVVLNAAGNAQLSRQDLLNATNCPPEHARATKTVTIKEITGKVIFSA